MNAEVALADRNDPTDLLGRGWRSGNADMEKVTGLGGLFFRAKEPRVLAKRYADHLGVNLADPNRIVSDRS